MIFKSRTKLFGKYPKMITGVTQKAMSKMWNDDQYENWGMLDRDLRVHIMQVDENINDHKRRSDKRR